MPHIEEIKKIVEFSYQPKLNQFVVRFLDGNTYALKTVDLPKKLQTRKPKWAEAVLSPSHSSIIFEAGKDLRQIPFHTIHSRGRKI